MSIARIINKWFKKNQHLFFKYSDGFYHLNYVANSPRLMMESFKKMLFCKFDEAKNVVTTDSPFNKARVQFAFLEDGLALMDAKMELKVNVCYHQVINEEVPNDYYTLSFNTFSNASKETSITMKSLAFSNKKWILTKPEFLSFTTYAKNSSADSILIYFNKKWLNDFIKSDRAYHTSKVKSFFESNEEFVVWPDNAIELSNMAKALQQTLIEEGSQNPLQLKLKTLELISTFIRTYDPQNIFKNYATLNKKDILRVNKVEFYLSENIQNKFMGIELLSEKFSVSPTKLKSDFKAAYGMGIFSYFRQKQMHIAKELLESGAYQVKEVAQLFGYDSRSKFSKAFETVNGALPSTIVFSKN